MKLANIDTVVAMRGVNDAALARVSNALPELLEKTKGVDRSNSQSTLLLMSLTMLNGHSPMRLIRQVLAEVDSRRLALAEAQVTHAELLAELAALEVDPPSPVRDAKLRLKTVSLATLESKINGAVKDIAILVDAYEGIKEKHSIGDWDEATYERAEKLHHVRRGFELLYRSVVQSGRASETVSEYLQQYGVHVQMALRDVISYINDADERITSGQSLDASDIEAFLDRTAQKYAYCADIVSARLFGKADATNEIYMERVKSDG